MSRRARIRRRLEDFVVDVVADRIFRLVLLPVAFAADAWDRWRSR